MPNLSFGGPGNPFDQFVADLIAGLQDGSIIPTKVDTNLDLGGKTYYNIEFVDKGRAGQVTHLTKTVSALPGAKTYKKIKVKSGTEPALGFRDFELTDTIHGLLLRSRNGAFWPPRKRHRALCQKDALADHDVPSLDCECGIYAYDTPDHPNLKRDVSLLWGEVALWGEVLVCETGYRAEYAYPTALFIRDAKNSGTVRKIRDELSETYGVPVFLVHKRSGQTSSQMIQEALTAFLDG